MKSERLHWTRWALFGAFFFGTGLGLGFSVHTQAGAFEARAQGPKNVKTSQDDGPLLSTPDIVDRVTPAVVTIYSTRAISQASAHSRLNPTAPEWPPHGREHGLGSGILVDPQGIILTNNHVIEGALELRVVLSDRREFVPKLVGCDQKTDLAVLKIEASNLPTLPFGDSGKARVGEFVLAVGNPLGVGETVSKGIISAKGRAHVGVADYEDFLQTDAAINPGNSGGALVNMKGELIGINTAIASPTGGFNGIGFAIPSNMARHVMQILLKDGRVTRGQLGIGVQDMTPELAKAIEGAPDRGVLISHVVAGSPAELAGLKAGDIILKDDDTLVSTAAQLRNQVSLKGAGARTTLTLWRDQKTLTITVHLRQESTPASSAAEERDVPPANDQGSGCGLKGIKVAPATPELLASLGLPDDWTGMIVTAIDPSKASGFLSLSKGDLVIEVNRTPVETLGQMKRAVEKGKPAVLLTIRRKEGPIYVAVPKEGA